MNAMSIRRIEPEVHDWLREQAAQHGVSMEEEVRALLRAARDRAEAERWRDEQARWQAIFAKTRRLPPGAPNTTDLIREDRDSR